MKNVAGVSIHNHFLRSYEVDAFRREINLKTGFQSSTETSEAIVIFSEVAAYHFTNDNFETILFGISEVDPKSLVEENWSLFETGWRDSGWPGEWGSSRDKATAHILKNSVRGFLIESSIGMSGWVLAKSARIVSQK